MGRIQYDVGEDVTSTSYRKVGRDGGKINKTEALRKEMTARRIIITLGICALLVAFIPVIAHAQDNPFPPLVIQSPGVMWNKTGRSLLAPLGVQTSIGTDYYIKLVDAETNRDAVAIYVIGGQDLEVLVPLGSYRMRYAYGETWRGEHHLFGPEDLTAVEEALEIFDFSESYEGFSGYTVELIPQIDGNLPTRVIARDEF